MKKLQKLIFVTFLVLSFLASFLNTHAQAPLIIKSSHSYISYIPYISAGIDATICFNSTYKTMGETNIEGTSYWISDGSGYFENPFNPKTIYMPSRDDMDSGGVTLSLYIIPQDISMPTIHDDVLLQFKNCIAY